MATKRKAHDWDAIERDWRTGTFTLRELETKHKVDNTVIARRMKQDRKKDPSRWQKDLQKVVRQATNAALMSATVSKMVSEGQQDVSNTVLAAAELNKRVILGHREELTKLRGVALGLLDEVVASRLSEDEQRLLTEILASGGSDADLDKAREAVRKALSRSSRVTDAKALAEIIGKVQAGERVAYGLNEDDGKSGDYEEFIATLKEAVGP
jgi:hypothetical protein